MAAIKLAGAEAQAAIDNDGFVVIDVYADWCGPCKMLAPFLDQIADESGTKIVKVDGDANADFAQKHSVSALPTVIFFKDGKEVDRFVGFRAKPQIEQIINSHK